MKSAQKIIATGAVLAMSITALSACGSSTADASKGKVYFLNTKPEIVDQLQELADAYTDETGVSVDIQTAASGTSNQTLTSELSKKDGPSMFNLAGFDQYAKFKDYLEPVQDSEAYKLLTDEGKSYSFKDGDTAYTIPYAAEWYGIIYNKKIVNEYAKKSYSVIKSADDITSWDVLKKVADSMQEHKDDLGLDGAFSTPGLDASDNYRFAAHMDRIPLFYELKDLGKTFSLDITGKYMDHYKDLWDTMVKDSPTEASLIGSGTYEDSTAEFSTGTVAFYPNGVWAYSQIKDNNVADEDLGMLPYYMGIPGEEDYGPGVIMDNQWVVNKNASKADQEATLKFIEWVQTSDEAKRIVAKEMGFAMPATTYGDDAQPDNPLVDQALAYQKEGKKYIRSFELPSLAWQKDFGGALLEYVQGTKDWDNVRKVITDEWKSTWEANEKAAPGSLPAQKEFTE